MARKKKSENDVVVYKVCMPLWIGWDKQEIELARYFKRDEAQSHIDNYINLFIKPFLYIKEVNVRMEETD